MGARGKKSKHPPGVGHITKAGYHIRCLWDPIKKTSRLIFQHVLLWEDAHGSIPEGYCLHHINEDKLDNRLENLKIVTHTEHKRLHSNCRKTPTREWEKWCPLCRQWLPIRGGWYTSKEGWPLYGKCRQCHIKRVVKNKQKKRLKHATKGETP